MINENINLERGLINGTRAKTSTINLMKYQQWNTLHQNIDWFGLQIKLKWRVIHYKYLFHGKFFKATFPLTLVCAMTGHKSQVATISSKLIYDIKNSFTPELTYVMLPRVMKKKFSSSCVNWTQSNFAIFKFKVTKLLNQFPKKKLSPFFCLLNFL